MHGIKVVMHKTLAVSLKCQKITQYLITCFSMLVPPTIIAVFNDSSDLLKALTCKEQIILV